MGGEWNNVQLGDVAINHDARRQPVKESDRRPGPFPYYGASGIVDWVDGYNFEGNFVLVAEDGENLRTRQTPVAFPATGRFWVNNHAHVLSGSNRISTRFLLYSLLVADIAPFLTGAVMPKLTQASLHRIPLRLPAYSEQERITELLGALDDKVELNRRKAETLEAIARALFKSWFVDFDPVHARAEGRPNGFPDDLAALFPDSFSDDGLPQGWHRNPLTRFFAIYSGGTPKTSMQEYWGGNIPWFSIADTPSPGTVFVVETEKSISRHGLENSPAQLVEAGSTIISARGTVGNLAMAGVSMAFNQSCYGLRGIGSIGDCFVFLAAQNMAERLKAMSHGSVFSTITRDTFSAVDFTKPTDAVFLAFEQTVQPVFERLKSLVVEIQTLSVLRDTLLPKLISGELRIVDAERQVAAA